MIYLWSICVGHGVVPCILDPAVGLDDVVETCDNIVC